MSELGFDVRDYCERLAKACPDRFTEVTVTVLTSRSTYENVWQVVDSTRPNLPVRLNLDWTLWAFFGPLADERKIAKIHALITPTRLDGSSASLRASVAFKVIGGFIPMSTAYDSLLESIIAAVVESFESGEENRR